MKSNSKTYSYFALLNRFWALDETHQFTPQAAKLYFYLLNTANKNRWPARFPLNDARAAIIVGVTLTKIKTARRQLEEAGLIEVPPGGQGHGQKTVYRIVNCAGCSLENSAACLDTCDHPDAPRPTRNDSNPPVGETPPNADFISSNRPSAQPSPSSDPELDIDRLTPPDDGVPRNFSGLRQRLHSLGATSAEIIRIFLLSNYGQIGHPVWAALAALRSGTGIKMPIPFIFARLKYA